MKSILFICSSVDWHMEQWLPFWVERYRVILFSDRNNGQARILAGNTEIQVLESKGIIGKFLIFFGLNSGVLTYINKLVSIYFYKKAIERIIRTEKPDFVHAHSLYYGLLGSLACGSVPLIFTPMGSDLIIHAQKSYLHYRFAKLALSKAALVSGDSKVLLDSCKKIYRGDLAYILVQNGVDLRFFPKPKKERYDHGSKTRVRLLSPRGLASIYNIEIIIEALWELVNDNSDGFEYELRVVYPWGGERLSKVKSLVKKLQLEEYVVWLGMVNYHDMHSIYSNSDIVISIPSSDSSPKSIYEALSVGTPVIVSDLPWVEERIGRYVTTTSLDATSLAETVRYCAGSYDSVVKMTDIGSQLVRDEFSYHANMRKLELAIHQLLPTS